MSVKSESKINQLLQEVPAGAVYLTSWMKQNNIPHSTQHRYIESAWLTPIGTGVMIRTGDTPTLYGAMYSLNTQVDKHLTIGAMSALEIHGYSHYLPMGRPTVSLSAPQKEYLPLWFRKYDWGGDAPAVYHRNIQFRHRNHHHPTRGFRVADLYP